MLIALVYDPRWCYPSDNPFYAQCDDRETIRTITNILQELGHAVEEVHGINELIENLVNGKRWDFVFNSCAGLHGIGHEVQVPCLLEANNIPYTFSDPFTIACAQDKSIMKKIAAFEGISTSKFAVARNIADIENSCLKYPLFVKPLALGDSIGINNSSYISNSSELSIKAKELFSFCANGILIEEYLPGKEYSVGVIGNGASSTILDIMEVNPTERADKVAYTFDNKATFDGRIHYQLVNQGKIFKLLEAMSLKIWQSINGRDAGRIEFRSDAFETPHLIEVNCLPGLHPVKSDLAIMSKLGNKNYQELIQLILSCFFNRVPHLRVENFSK